MGRLSSAVDILNAADRWKQRCLLAGGSLLTEERLWTKENFRHLRTYYIQRPDEGPGSFEEKLRRQLDPAPHASKRLWAEMTWAYYLIVSHVKRLKKLDRIKTVWEWSERPLPKDHPALGDVLDKGVANPGTAYFTGSWREYRFIVSMMLDWCGHSAEDRESLLSNPWHFADWIDSQEASHNRQFRHILLFLLFPDFFERILTSQYKSEIVEAFAAEHDHGLDVRQMSNTEIDRALLAIRKRLEAKNPDDEIDFYQPRFRRVWQPASTTTPKDVVEQDVVESDEDTETWYRERFGQADVWAIGAGNGGRLWPEFQELQIAAISWDDLGDFSEYNSKESVHNALIRLGFGPNPSNTSLAVWQFVNEMRIGDFLIAKKGRNVILGWGKVTGKYVYEPERTEYRNLRSVEWHPCRTPITLGDNVTTKTLTSFSDYKGWLRNTFRLIDQGSDGSQTNGPARYRVELALKDLFVDDRQFSRIVDLIAQRKNLILQGPPGVGKTFIARRIAWCLIQKKDSEPIEIVQFHQSYSYEDFVQGWRPTEKGGFEVRNGVFFEFCKRAAERPDTPFVFIIDEINRGNLSRIFGELLMLIEADKRGPNHAIALTYGEPGKRFSVPDNVYLLGLMNTADRSLAIVDYALRRRFAFETLRPAYGTQKFRDYLLDADVDPSIVNRIDQNLTALNDAISNDRDLGPGFQIGHSYFVPDESADEQWYRNVIDTEIEPLLREYWFDRPKHVDELVENLRR